MINVWATAEIPDEFPYAEQEVRLGESLEFLSVWITDTYSKNSANLAIQPQI